MNKWLGCFLFIISLILNNLRFKKIYIEITNVCNFHCSFCVTTSRANQFISPENFSIIVEKIRPFTDYIYLHVLGEPLLHPRFADILEIAHQAGLNVNITTNGGLIEKKNDILLSHAIRQINVSLHDAEENVAPQQWEQYLNSVLNYAVEAAPNTYVNLRLWNAGVESSSDFNRNFITKIAERFNIPVADLQTADLRTSFKLADRVFIQYAPRFDWPDGITERSQGNKTCYALRDQLAILVDGTVVPCCIDAEGNMPLGNVFTTDLSEILASQRAEKIRIGFMNHKITEDFCKSCGFFV